MSAPSDDQLPKALKEDGHNLFLNDKLLVPRNRVEALIDHWHTAHPRLLGREEMP